VNWNASARSGGSTGDPWPDLAWADAKRKPSIRRRNCCAEGATSQTEPVCETVALPGPIHTVIREARPWLAMS